MADEKEGGDSQEVEKPKNNMMMFIVITVVLIGLSIGGTLFFIGGNEEKSAADAGAVVAEPVAKKSLDNAIYVDLDPVFTVNLMAGSTSNFLQIAVSILTYYDDSEEAINRHIPEIRNSLLMLFGEQTSQTLAGIKAKAELRTKAFAAVKKVLSDRGEKADIEAIFFTKFVMQ